MKKCYLNLMVCAVFLTTGCDHYSNKMIAMQASDYSVGAFSEIAPAAGGELTFREHLAQEYYQLAFAEQDISYDYLAAKRYFDKAEILSKGKVVPTDSVDNYNIEGAEYLELVAAHRELNTALKEHAIPENRAALAKAHAQYDCWLDEADEKKTSTQCKAKFRQAMNSLVYPVIYTEQDDAFFDDVFDLDI